MLLVLDPYHLSDPLFVTGLARDLAARGEGAVLVHGSAERGERALEALGVVPEPHDGAWVVTDEEQAEAVERATRTFNREIVHELNEAGVASTRVMGADRGLLKVDEGAVIATNTAWLRTLVDQGVVAVVASLVASADGDALREVAAAAAAAALAEAMVQPVTVLLRTGLLDDAPAVSLQSERDRFGDPDAVGRLLARGVEVRAVPRGAVRNPGQEIGKSVLT